MNARKLFSFLTPLFTLFFLWSAAAFAQRPCDCGSSAPEGCVPPPPPISLHEAAGGFPQYGTTRECLQSFGYPIPPEPTKNVSCKARTYEEAVRDAYRWREALGVTVSRGLKAEQEIAARLKAVNSSLTYRSLAQESDCGNGLIDSLLVLRVAAIVMREHGQPLVAQRFELEAEWIRIWLNEVMGGANQLIHATILEWWMEVADLWVRNARSIVGPVLIKEEPIATLFTTYGYVGLKSLQKAPWYAKRDDYSFPIGDFYRLKCVKSRDPWLWMKFKAMPLGLCSDGPYTVVSDGVMTPEVNKINKEIEKLIIELIGE